MSNDHLVTCVTDALDLCDTNGAVQGVQKLLPMEQVGQLVTHKEIYVPIIVNTSTSRYFPSIHKNKSYNVSYNMCVKTHLS